MHSGHHDGQRGPVRQDEAKSGPWRPCGGLVAACGGLPGDLAACGGLPGDLAAWVSGRVLDRAAGGPLAARWRPAGGPHGNSGGPLAACVAILAARWRPALQAWRPLAARAGSGGPWRPGGLGWRPWRPSGGLRGGLGGLWRPALAAPGGLAALAASWRPLQHCLKGSH
eukprot:gene14530-biopygen10899